MAVAGSRRENLVEMAALRAALRGHPAKIERVSDPADPDHIRVVPGSLKKPIAASRPCNR